MLSRKILLVALETNWPALARLPRALQNAGFTVGVACRAKAFLAHTRHRDHFFRLPEKNHGAGLLAALRTIVSAWAPDFILPADDRTALFLTQVHECLVSEGNATGMGALLRRSLGNPASTREALSKRQTLEIARELGIRAPAGRPVETVAETLEFARQHGFPVVLKRSFDFGGHGVFICQNQATVIAAWDVLRRNDTRMGRLRYWREQFRGRLMESAWLPSDPSVTVNQFIAGQSATSLTAAVGGDMLAVLTAQVEQTYPDLNGPASVVRLVRNEEMCRVSQIMLNHWGLTGLIGFDFILDASGQAWLLECNPRSTPLAHLGARVGEDLCAALYQRLVQKATVAPWFQRPVPKELLVAHFPQETWREPNSPYFQKAFHDVPVDDPALLEILSSCRPSPRKPF
jgi:Carbamoyl-phosphate synthase L chain, ATP binding domain